MSAYAIVNKNWAGKAHEALYETVTSVATGFIYTSLR